MLFALIGFYRKGAEERLPEIADDINEYLGQPVVPPQLASVLRAENGERTGNLVVVEAPGFEEAKARLQDSPALKAGLYDRCEIVELQIEVGGIATE